MMLIQAVLIILLLVIAVQFIRSRNTSKVKAYKKIFLLLFIPVSIIVVLFPAIATEMAHLVGVGRGADLLLYGVTVVMIFQLFNNYIKDRENQRKTVVLSRKIAIIEAKTANLKP
jgi:small membrane protein